MKKIIFACMALLVAACSSFSQGDQQYPIDPADKRRIKHGKVTGDGIQLFDSDEGQSSGGNAGIGINSYLWRASLDTLSFMPLASADPFGGVIITDWYEDPATPNERFKVNVFILDTKLRADGLQVTVFKQRKEGTLWRDAPTNKVVASDLENKILTRARELRVSQVRH